MKCDYLEISEKLRPAEGEPLWYDEIGVPRYSPLHPVMVNRPGCTSCAFFIVECDVCKKQFTVCYSMSNVRGCFRSVKEHIIYIAVDGFLNSGRPIESKNWALDYREPPYHLFNSKPCDGNHRRSNFVSFVSSWFFQDGEWKSLSEKDYKKE